MRRVWLKYLEVSRTTVRSRWAYLWDQVLGGLFLVIIMFVYVQLWRTTYASGSGGDFAGYTLPEIIWYLVFAEAIILSLPRIDAVLDQEVKDGDLALRLNKPYNYLLFHYFSFMGDCLLRVVTWLVIGGVTVYLLVGGFPFRWEGLPAMFSVFLITQTLNFCYGASIGMASFWVEDVSGLYLLLDKVKWVLGGFMIPIELYPATIRRIAEALPFRHMVGGPARLFVKFSWAGAGELLLLQGLWLLAFVGVCLAIFRLGVRKVDVNGG